MMLCPYVILDAQYQTADEMAQFVMQLCDVGVQVYQLRMKAYSQGEVKAVALYLYPLIWSQGAKLLLNDHVTLAAELGLDGVHIGQDDMSALAARRCLGGEAMIGLSVQTLRQLHIANAHGVMDYVGVGPIFPTQSKVDAALPIGISLLEEMCANSRVPVVALGGVKPQHLHVLHNAGAQSAVMIRALIQSAKPAEIILYLKTIFI